MTRYHNRKCESCGRIFSFEARQAVSVVPKAEAAGTHKPGMRGHAVECTPDESGERGKTPMTTLFAPTQPITFTVMGRARPQGSKRHVGNGIMIESSKALKPWRQEVAGTALSLNVPMIPAHVPLELTVNFYFAKPKSSKRTAMTTKPDSSKLLRAIEDALTGILFYDDSQIVKTFVGKHYGRPDRCECEIRICEAV